MNNMEITLAAKEAREIIGKQLVEMMKTKDSDICTVKIDPVDVALLCSGFDVLVEVCGRIVDNPYGMAAMLTALKTDGKENGTH